MKLRACPPCDSLCHQGRYCPNDTRPSDDAWLDAGIALSKCGDAYGVVVGFICGVLTATLGVWVVARWLL